MISMTMKLACSLLAAAAFTHGSPTPRSSRATALETHYIRDTTNPFQSTNWAGAVVGPTDTSFYSVKGSFLAPTPKLPAGASKTSEGVWGGAAWVGIDGVAKGEGGLFQAGIDWKVSNAADGTLDTVFEAWYEWVPAPMMSLGAFNVTPGDIITVQCEANNSTHGTCSVENQSTGQLVSKDMTPPSAANHLVGHHAEWIVEDFDAGSSEIPFADFGTVEWYDCEAAARPVGDVVGDPRMFYPKDGQQYIMVDSNGKTLTNVSTSLEKMTVVYAG
ncbi:concanavalin A-like lectin/glucanase [Stipitochalara longipes BDJ]|nr:concanavalin A-like lectin/glucanase [Stipitochalara longipes BDJ]